MTNSRLQMLLKKGLKLYREGRVEEAEGCRRKMLEIDPTSAEVHEFAEWLQTKAVPESADAYQRAGEAQERCGDLQAAADFYKRALTVNPDSAELHCHLARVLGQAGAYQPAAELYRRALGLDPKRLEIYSDLGFVLTELGNLDLALEAFRRALRANPRSAKTIASVGRLFERKCDLVSAAEAYRDAIKLDPKLLPAYADLGFVLYGLGEFGEAADCFGRLLALQPNSAEARVNLGLIHLLQGELLKGWTEYEARWQVGVGDDRKLAPRRWKGEPLKGERILLYAEQGLGDALQFVRYVPLVADCGGQVVLEVQPALRGLIAITEGAAQVIARGDTLPECTWQCPLLSLPLALGTKLETIPARVPYIHPDPARVEKWKQRLAGDTWRIGLCWAGNPSHQRDRLRSVPLEQLLPLLGVTDASFYSLQFGAGAEQIQWLPANVRLVDLGDELRDFSNLAAIVANLDLVITIDSVVAHLAGAMGKPVWILLNKGCDWRWFLEREDSPWYPTARLFRQSTPGGWQEVVNRIELELRRSPTG